MGVTSGPKGGMGLAMLLDNIREVGAGDCMYQITEMIQSLYHLSTRTVVHFNMDCTIVFFVYLVS